jgi:hypothetical protein
MTNRQLAQEELNQLMDLGIDPERILNFILNNHMSGLDAVEALTAFKAEELGDVELEEVEDPFQSEDEDIY